MGTMSPLHWLIVLGIILLLFGGKKILSCSVNSGRV